MEYSLANLPPSLAYYAEKVAQSQQPQQPHQNFVVPNKRTINRLKHVIALYGQLPKSEPFNYGTSSTYRKKPVPPPSTQKPIEFNKINDLPLFQKR
jgi:hypothetical protein